MNRLFRFESTQRRDPKVEERLRAWDGVLGALARERFEELRGLGDDVREVLHDGQPTACVGDAAFAYVDVYTAHVNLGFFDGAHLPDPSDLLEGHGKFMRHVKFRSEAPPDAGDVRRLMEAAYAGMRKAVHGADG